MEFFILVHCAKEEKWLNIVSKSLHPDATYVKLSLIRLIGIMEIAVVEFSTEGYKIRKVFD